LNSLALTKIQSIILIAVIVVAFVGGGIAYVLLSGQEQSSEPIRIGILADLDYTEGKALWQEALLAAEQINSKGGILGREIEIVAEDDDIETGIDPNIANLAITKLITVDKVDYIISYGGSISYGYMDFASNHKKIIFEAYGNKDEITQRVLDDYDKYKYYFKCGFVNSTITDAFTIDAIKVLREYTGFNKIAFLSPIIVNKQEMADTLTDEGFEVVYLGQFPLDCIDFTSYFAQAEAAGAEIVYPTTIGQFSVIFVKEWYERQSPTVIWGGLFGADKQSFWDSTDGKCETTSLAVAPTQVGYPITTKTIAFCDAYTERWGEDPTSAVCYDIVRYVLPDAIERAGTTETEAVIKTLETTEIETSHAKKFAFSKSHDILVGEIGLGNPDTEHHFACLFQWQNGELVPVYPKSIMEEAGVTYTFPDWPGPWDNID